MTDEDTTQPFAMPAEQAEATTTHATDAGTTSPEQAEAATPPAADAGTPPPEQAEAEAAPSPAPAASDENKDAPATSSEATKADTAETDKTPAPPAAPAAAAPAPVPAPPAPAPLHEHASEASIRVKWYVDALIEGHVYHGYIKNISLYGTGIYLDLNLQKIKTLKLRIHVPPASKTSPPHLVEVSGKVTFIAYDNREGLFQVGVHFTEFKQESERQYLQARIAAFNRAK